jgi:Heparinase II/III-like protein/Heparinase II/III N-terminus
MDGTKTSMNRFFLYFKSLRELGPKSLMLYARYRIGLASGYYRMETRRPLQIDNLSFNPVLLFPSKEELLKVLGSTGQAQLLAEADEIVEGKVRLFSGDSVPLQLVVNEKLSHWTHYETGMVPYPSSEFNDVKFIWEPARFGWAFILGRAYLVSGDERYSRSFWEKTELFLESNPPFLGPQWTSGQEVAIRLMALVWAGQIFTGSPESTRERMEKLSVAIAAHAERIPPTLVYARSQNNNHLLTEAAGMYTASLVLPDHPRAEKWRKEGWKWLDWAFKKQIFKDGAYTQHSTNYHRLMLQLALWVWTLANLSPARRGGTPQKTEAQWSLAAKWLSALTDRESGQAANLGANDGAYLFPLTICTFSDYRPVVQAASLILAGEKPFVDGPWNEMALWFGQKLSLIEQYAQTKRPSQQFLLESPTGWAYLRAEKFKSRPSHADQLHLDLWWRGMNIARDAGTFLYNAAPPWDNSLTVTHVHNTITVNGREQMTRAGRFLYLGWALGGFIESKNTSNLQRLVARQHGYKSLGIVHQRTVKTSQDGGWIIEDELMPKRTGKTICEFRLHWLLPDWEWRLDQQGQKVELGLKSPLGWVTMTVTTTLDTAAISLVRCGERLVGEGHISPQEGWCSLTYGQKEPALSFAVKGSGAGTVQFKTDFTFPRD